MQQTHLTEWIRSHAPLQQLCEHGGWPDADHMQIDIRHLDDHECIVDIEFTESSMEISECDIHEATHGGEFRISLDACGQPTNIHLLTPLWNEGDPLL